MGILTAFLLTQAIASVDALDSAVTAGIEGGVYPGAVLMIGRADTVMVARAYGHHTWKASSPPMRSDSTWFDLASLTKVVATTTAIMLLVDEAAVRLDEQVVTYLPRFVGDGKDVVTVRQLLSHTSGLPAYRAFFREAESRDAMLSLVYAEPLVRAPGTRAEYSDLNAILLGELVAAVTGESLDRFVRHRVFLPLDMRQTRFGLPREVRDRAAPTGVWRGQAVRGVVHDQNAARLEGVAGHAGVFSTGEDVARFAQFVLRFGDPLVARTTFVEFTARQNGTGDRALGWVTTPTTEETSSAGDLLHDGSVGHTGFTGTSMWIDHRRDLFIVLLTNRVYDPQGGTRFTALKRVRGAVADIAASWIDWYACEETSATHVACE